MVQITSPDEGEHLSISFKTYYDHIWTKTKVIFFEQEQLVQILSFIVKTIYMLDHF
jgi:hypothetical protein